MKPFSIASWNINSVRLRVELVSRFLKLADPDIMCLQETKCTDEKLPLENFKKLGYEFTSEEVEKVVNLARKRKVGTRPKKFIKLRRK